MTTSTKRRELTSEIANEFLRYDPDTGNLYWKFRDPKWFSDGLSSKEIIAKRWNSKNAGRLAFTTKDVRGAFQGRIFNVLYKAHRIIWLMENGEWPDQDLDHIDGNPSNNKLDNLRAVSHKENGRNMSISVANSSGVAGVYWNAKLNKWQAYIKVDGVAKYLGVFCDIEEAREERKAAEKKYNFHENHGRKKRGD